MLKKALALFLSITLLLSFSGCKTKQSTRSSKNETEEDLVTVYALTERVSGDERIVFKFDRFGNPTFYAGYEDGKETYLQEIEDEYDRNGNMIRSSYKQDNFEDYRRVTDYTYDNDGNLILAVSTRDSQEIDRTEYKYDSNGNMVLCVNYRNGQEYSRDAFEYKYDNNEIVTSYIEFEDNGQEKWSIDFQYDSNGRLTREIRIGSHYPYLAGETIYEYNSQGNLLREVACDEGGRETGYYTVYEYDTRGNRTLAIHYRDGQEMMRDEYSSNGMTRTAPNTDDYAQYTKMRVSKSQAHRLMLSSDYVYIFDHFDK